MKRLAAIALLLNILISTFGCQLGPNNDVTRGTDNSELEYFRAKHGDGNGLSKKVPLSVRKGFDSVRNIDDVAKFAAKVPGAIGFTAHPHFEQGTRYASAILWYTTLSSPQNSWPFYLFDETEAKKQPGDKPRTQGPGPEQLGNGLKKIFLLKPDPPRPLFPCSATWPCSRGR